MKLQYLLTEYLFTNNSLPLAGAGQLQIKSNTASIVQADNLLTPPTNRIVFSTVAPDRDEQQKLSDFVGKRLAIDNDQLANLMTEEASLPKILAAGHDHFDWEAVGIFQKREDGTISFTQTDVLANYLPDIVLEKTAKKTDLEAPVAEPITTQIEPVFDYVEPIQKDRWWIWAVVIFVVSIVLILIRYYA